MKKHLPTVILISTMFVGMGLIAYPYVSNAWNVRVQSHAVAVYDDAVASMTDAEYSEYLEAANAYNEEIYQIGSDVALANSNIIDDYEELLDITGTGIMGYVTIEKINVQLPIYHGTDSGVLEKGAGHLKGSSLPVGGVNTHSVISAHRGLPAAKLFTNLDQLEIGDIFTVTVLNRVLTYEVDQITVVLPTELNNIYIVNGMDYITLMTCTPYGINSHRLLVRGVRTTEPDKAMVYVSSDALEIETFKTVPVIAVPVLLIFPVCLMTILNRIRKSKQGKSEK